MTLGQWFLLSEPQSSHLQNGSSGGMRVKDDCKTELSLIHRPPVPRWDPHSSTHVPTHMLYWALSHFLLQ